MHVPFIIKTLPRLTLWANTIYCNTSRPYKHNVSVSARHFWVLSVTVVTWVAACQNVDRRRRVALAVPLGHILFRTPKPCPVVITSHWLPRGGYGETRVWERMCTGRQDIRLYLLSRRSQPAMKAEGRDRRNMHNYPLPIRCITKHVPNRNILGMQCHSCHIF